MNKRRAAAAKCRSEIVTALRAVADALNHGQRQKLMKDEAVSRICLRYGVDMSVEEQT